MGVDDQYPRLSDLGFQNVRFERMGFRGEEGKPALLGNQLPSMVDMEAFNRLQAAEKQILGDTLAEAEKAEQEFRNRVPQGYQNDLSYLDGSILGGMSRLQESFTKRVGALPVSFTGRFADMMSQTVWAGEWARDQIGKRMPAVGPVSGDPAHPEQTDEFDKTFLVQRDEDGEYFIDQFGKRQNIPQLTMKNPSPASDIVAPGMGPTGYQDTAGNELQKMVYANIGAMRRAYRMGQSPGLKWVQDVQDAFDLSRAYYTQTATGRVLGEVGFGLADLAAIWATGAATKGVLTPVTRLTDKARIAAAGAEFANVTKGTEFAARMGKLLEHSTLPVYMALNTATEYIRQHPEAPPSEVGGEMFKGGALGTGMAAGFYGLGQMDPVPFHKLFGYYRNKVPSVWNRVPGNGMLLLEQKASQFGGGAMMMGYPWMYFDDNNQLRLNLHGMVTGGIYGMMTPGAKTRSRVYMREAERLQMAHRAASMNRPKKVFAPRTPEEHAAETIPFARELVQRKIPRLNKEDVDLIERMVTNPMTKSDGTPLSDRDVISQYGRDYGEVSRLRLGVEMFRQVTADPMSVGRLWTDYLNIDRGYTRYRPLENGKPSEMLHSLGPEANTPSIHGWSREGPGAYAVQPAAPTSHRVGEKVPEITVPGNLIGDAFLGHPMTVELPETARRAKALKEGKSSTVRLQWPHPDNLSYSWLGLGVRGGKDAKNWFRESRMSKNRKRDYDRTGIGDLKVDSFPAEISLTKPKTFETEAEAREWFRQNNVNDNPQTHAAVRAISNWMLKEGYDGVIIGKDPANPDIVVAYDQRSVKVGSDAPPVEIPDLKLKNSIIAQIDDNSLAIPFWSKGKKAGGGRYGDMVAIVRPFKGTEPVTAQTSRGVPETVQAKTRESLTATLTERGQDQGLKGKELKAFVEDGLAEQFPTVKVPRQGYEVVEVRKMTGAIDDAIHGRQTDANAMNAHYENMRKRLGSLIRNHLNNENRWTRNLTQDLRDSRMDVELQRVFGDEVQIVGKDKAPDGIAMKDGKTLMTRDYALDNLTQAEYFRLRGLLSTPGPGEKELINPQDFYVDDRGYPDPSRPNKKGAYPIFKDEWNAVMRMKDLASEREFLHTRGILRDLTNPIFIFEKLDPLTMTLGEFEAAAKARKSQAEGEGKIAIPGDGLPKQMVDIFFREACHAYYEYIHAMKVFRQNWEAYESSWKERYIDANNLKRSDGSRATPKDIPMKQIEEKMGTIRVAMDKDGRATLARHFQGELDKYFPFEREAVQDELGNMQKQASTFPLSGEMDPASVYQLLREARPQETRHRDFLHFRMKPEFELTPLERELFRFRDQQFQQLRDIYSKALLRMHKDPLQHDMGYYRMFRVSEGFGSGGFSQMGNPNQVMLDRELDMDAFHLSTVATRHKLRKAVGKNRWIFKSKRDPDKPLEQLRTVRDKKQKTVWDSVVPIGERKARTHSSRMVTLNDRIVLDRFADNLLRYSYMEPAMARMNFLLEYTPPDGNGLEAVAPNSKKYLKIWINYNSGKQVAGDIAQLPFVRELDRIAEKFAKNVHYAVLGGNLRTALIQFSALRGAWQYAGAKNTMKALKYTMDDFIETGATVPYEFGKGVLTLNMRPGDALHRATMEAAARWKQGFFRGQYDRSTFLPTREGDSLFSLEGRKSYGAIDTQGVGGLEGVTKGMNAIFTPEGKLRKGMNEAKVKMVTLGDLGFKPLEFSDWFTTRVTRGAFELKGQELGIPVGPRGSLNADWADEWAMKAAGSTTRMNRTPMQYTALGRAIGVFQNFNIMDWNTMMHETLGARYKTMSHAERFRRMLAYSMYTTMNNIFYEDLMPAVIPEKAHFFMFGGGRFHSPHQTPFRALMGGNAFPIIAKDLSKEDIRKVVEDDDLSVFGKIVELGDLYAKDLKSQRDATALRRNPDSKHYIPMGQRTIDAVKEVMEVTPILGGSLRYGSHPGGIIFGETFGQLTDLMADKNLGSDEWIAKFAGLAALTSGVPGLYQARKSYRGWTKYEKDGPPLTPQQEVDEFWSAMRDAIDKAGKNKTKKYDPLAEIKRLEKEAEELDEKTLMGHVSNIVDLMLSGSSTRRKR